MRLTSGPKIIDFLGLESPKGIMSAIPKHPRPYRPEDPHPGDLVFLGEDWKTDLADPKASDRAGVIIERLRPDHKGGLFNYRISVKMADGSIIQSESRAWKCLRQIISRAEEFAAVQKGLIKKLEGMAPKINELGPSLE